MVREVGWPVGGSGGWVASWWFGWSVDQAVVREAGWSVVANWWFGRLGGQLVVVDTSGQVGDGGHFGKAGHTVRQDSVVNGTYGGTYAHMAAHGATFCFK